MMYTLGVILARGGSQGLPHKHLLELHGQAVIEHTFAHVRAAARLSATLVSSDCPRILAFARQHGFQTVQRPADLATGDASVQDVLLHALDVFEATAGAPRVVAVATLYGNVPVRPAGVIDAAIDLLTQTGCDSVRSFCPVGKWHPAWMSRVEDATGTVTASIPGSIHRRQDLEPLYLHDGAIVVSSRAAMEAGRARRDDPHAFFGTDRRGVKVSNTDTVEVDTYRDLLLADAILRDRAAHVRGATCVT